MKVRAKSEIPYTQRRLIGLKDFALYTSLGRDKSIELAKTSRSIVRIGKRTLVDREAFDRWVETQKQAIEDAG